MPPRPAPRQGDLVLIETSRPDGAAARIVYRNGGPIDAAALERLSEKVGWPSRPLRKVEAALRNSYLVASLHLVVEAPGGGGNGSGGSGKQEELIGLARATSDHAFNATIWDVIVDPAYQVWTGGAALGAGGGGAGEGRGCRGGRMAAAAAAAARRAAPGPQRRAAPPAAARRRGPRRAFARCLDRRRARAWARRWWSRWCARCCGATSATSRSLRTLRCARVWRVGGGWRCGCGLRPQGPSAGRALRRRRQRACGSAGRGPARAFPLTRPAPPRPAPPRHSQVVDFYKTLGFEADPDGISGMFWYPREWK
jgi:hypothetical protein